MKPTADEVRKVKIALDKVYTSTDLGNKSNPLDELAYIILSKRTKEDRYQEVFQAFKRAFPKWSMVAEATLSEIQWTIWHSGLSRQNAQYLKSISLRLKNDFGEVSLRSLKRMKTPAAELYLTSLPGVGTKTARCVLMYSLNRKVFPVDVHCQRIMERLGWVDLNCLSAEAVSDAAQGCIPPGLRKAIHVRFVQHGREICKPNPNCDRCTIKAYCQRASFINRGR